LSDPERWRYGYELAQAARIGSGTLYPALARLADDGYLEHRWELPEPGGRPRHFYRLTTAGSRFAVAQRAVDDRRLHPRARLVGER
jgi:DNA-binding PadR family transcriptional regulator